MVVTEDSDLLVYGAPRVLFKLGGGTVSNTSNSKQKHSKAARASSALGADGEEKKNLSQEKPTLMGDLVELESVFKSFMNPSSAGGGVGGSSTLLGRSEQLTRWTPALLVQVAALAGCGTFVIEAIAAVL